MHFIKNDQNLNKQFMNDESITQNVEFQIEKKKFTTRGQFESNFINIRRVNYCPQGINYNTLRLSREGLRKNRFLMVRPFMNKDETASHKLIRQKLYTDQPKDIIYQFDTFYPDVSPEYTHIQLRKEIKFISDSELIFYTSGCFSILNIVTKKLSSLMLFDEDDLVFVTSIISYDAYRDSKENKIYLITGHYNSTIKYRIFDIDTTKVRKYKEVYKDVILLYDDSDKILINFVQFTSKDQIFFADNSNKCGIYSLKEKKYISTYEYTLPINYFCFIEKYNLVVAVGDFSEVLLFDLNSHTKIGEMKGHKDHGFVCKFNGDYTVATGNQDIQCKLWDVRKIDGNSCYKTLSGLINSIGNLDFIERNLMAFYENTDFIHIYDIEKNRQQTLDFFGDVPGSCVHRPTKKLYVGVRVNSYQGIMVYDKIDKFNLL